MTTDRRRSPEPARLRGALRGVVDGLLLRGVAADLVVVVVVAPLAQMAHLGEAQALAAQQLLGEAAGLVRQDAAHGGVDARLARLRQVGFWYHSLNCFQLRTPARWQSHGVNMTPIHARSRRAAPSTCG
jgi:hypothetical protein